MMTKHILSRSIVVCPYCNTKLKSECKDKEFGIMLCECDRYPVIENILFLQKDDLLTNKKLVTLIEKKQYFSAVYKSLSKSERLVKLIILFTYFSYKKWGVLIDRDTLLRLLRLVSLRSKSWYDYLLKRKNVPELYHATDLLIDIHNGAIILDIGTGIGHLYEKLHQIIKKKSITIIGIDKNFLSLLIARIYNPDPNYIIICADADYGLPFRKNSIDVQFYIDSFYQLFGINRQLHESLRVLKKFGRLCLLQLFSSNNFTKNWGYGISPTRMKSLLSNTGFRSIELINNQGTKFTKTHLQGVNEKSYSCVAIKE